MPTHLAFLRAINIGKRQYRMAQLRAAVEAAGFTDVETHIQTGNLRVSTPMRSQTKVAEALERVFLDDAGFEVRTIVLSPAELREIAADADALAAEHQPGHGHYISLLQSPAADAAEVEALSREGEIVRVCGRAVHLLYDVPYHQAKVSGAAVEKRLGVSTNRNAKVIRALAEKWGG